jgi:hypothetical protein
MGNDTGKKLVSMCEEMINRYPIMVALLNPCCLMVQYRSKYRENVCKIVSEAVKRS